jgi:plastocyanin
MTPRGLGLAVAMAVLAVGSGVGGPAAAADITALVRDQALNPLEDAVVMAVPGGETPPLRPGREAVDQINKQFVPYMKPVVVGTPVYFPNKDDIRHHVYSFSPAKTFELPLYSGTPAKPVVFDRAGVVTIGCNIHDWMIGHIYVATTPHVAKTGPDGKARLENLPAGRYAVRVWHPRLQEPETATSRSVTVERESAMKLTWELVLKPSLHPRRAPVAGPRGYR